MQTIQSNRSLAAGRILLQRDGAPMVSTDYGNNIWDFTQQGTQESWTAAVLNDNLDQIDGSFVRCSNPC
jgi:hypothetical protein